MNDVAISSPTENALYVSRHVRGNDPSWSLRYALAVLLGKWRLALITGAAIFIAVVGLGLLVPKTYYAEATLVVHPLHENLAQPLETQSPSMPDTSAVDTEVEIVRSPAIAEVVVRKLKLYQDTAFGESPDSAPTEVSIRKAVSQVMGNSRIRRIGLTYVVQVGYAGNSVEQAKEIANAIVTAYMSHKLDEKLAAVTHANQELGSTLGTLRKQSVEAESRAEDYEAKNNLLSADGKTLTEAELSALNQKIADAQADGAEKEARMTTALAQAKHGGASDVGATLASGTIGALRQKEADASATLSQLQTQFQADYPPVQKAQAQLNDIRKQLQSETGRILSSLRADAQAASRREASLLASRKVDEDKLASSSQARVGLLTLQQEADSAKKIYEAYLSRASNVAAARGLQAVDSTVESRAVVLPNSGYTSLRFIALLAVFLAAVGAVIAVIVSAMGHRKILSWNDVSRETGLPLAGILPDVKALGIAGGAAGYIVDRPLTVIAEAFRNLRAYVAFAAKNQRAKVIALTSSVPGEGKTLASICLARTFAAAGERVVLLDCDLRRRSASGFFADAPFGMVDVIERGVPLDQALARDGKSGIWILAGSTDGYIPDDLFGGSSFNDFLYKLSERFDRIIIDAPPVLGFADARILASKADQVLFFVRWNKTEASVVRAAREVLAQCHAHVAGVVLNKVNLQQQARYGFGDGSDYYNYYGPEYLQQA